MTWLQRLLGLEKEYLEVKFTFLRENLTNKDGSPLTDEQWDAFCENVKKDLAGPIFYDTYVFGDGKEDIRG